MLRRAPVTILLVTMLAALPLGIVWFAFVTSGSTLAEVQTEFAKDVYRVTSRDIAHLTAEYLTPISATARRSASQLATGLLDADNEQAADDYLRLTLESEPRITSIAWYPQDGVVHRVQREETGYISRSFDPNAEEPSVKTAWMTPAGNLITESAEPGTLTVSDPLLRAESEIEHSAVSSPGIGLDGQTETVTFAASAFGPAGGTVFVDIDLADLGDFIGEDPPAAGSRVFIVSGVELVAHNRPELIDRAQAGAVAASLPDAPTREASSLALGGDGWQLVTISDDAYHAVSTRVEGVSGLDWTVVTIGPEDDFSAQFINQRRTDALKLAAIAITAIFMAIPLARLTVRDVGSLHKAAHRDSLTGLVNRRTFEKQGAALVAAARRRRRSVGALMVDIDHFKQLNDTYGHHAGDEVLEAVAGRIAHSVAKTDLVARLGGDEIALLLEGADLAASRSVAARLKNAVTSSPISTNRGPIYVTISIGASATGGADRARLEDVLKAADRALYASKRAGRDRITAVELARTH